jgi:hypothetical protein
MSTPWSQLGATLQIACFLAGNSAEQDRDEQAPGVREIDSFVDLLETARRFCRR